MSPTIYLVTGAGRGIGFAIVSQLAAQSNTVVYAGIRSFPPASDSQLAQLVNKYPSVVIPIRITSANEADNAAAAAQIKEEAGKVDVVIANAGGSSHQGSSPILDLTPEILNTDYETNAIGPVILFKAVHSLLLVANAEASGSAKFIVVSSMAGSISQAIPIISFDSYGASKAAVNYLTKKIDHENPEIVAFPIHPGLVATDGSREISVGVDALAGFEMISPEQSAAGILGVVAKATKATHGGRFWDEKGVEMAF